MKKCNRCKIEKSLEEFRLKDKVRGTRQAYCIPCNKEYNREHYQKNKQDYLDKAKAWDLKQYDRVLDYLREHPCVDCAESDIVVLEFDHIDPKTKLYTVSQAIQKGFNWSRIKEEIAKCEVRCKNCHAKRTAKQFGWRKVALNNL